MIGYLIIALILVNLIMVINRKNSKVIALVSWVCLWLIMGLNTYTDDYPGYMSLYNSRAIGLTMEPGFTLLTSLSHSLGLSYDQFFGIFMFGSLCIGTAAARKVTKNYHVIICIFALTALYLNTDEIRQFMAYVLYTLALTFLTDEKRGKLKYGITVCIAATMQISAIALLPFPFIFGIMKNRRTVLKIYFSAIAVFCVVIYLNGNKIPFFFEIVSMFIPENKLGYFTTTTNLGFLLFFLANFLNMMVAYYGVSEVKNHAEFYSRRERQYALNLYDSILYLSFAMPLCMINSEFLRYFRFSVIPVIFMIAIMFNRKNSLKLSRNSRSVIKISRADLILVIYTVVYQFCMQHWRIVEQVIENNLLNH